MCLIRLFPRPFKKRNNHYNKNQLLYEKIEALILNQSCLKAICWKSAFFFTYRMYITARVSHLHENGRLSERDKPKASSCELDAVFGIPSRGGFFPPSFTLPLQI